MYLFKSKWKNGPVAYTLWVGIYIVVSETDLIFTISYTVYAILLVTKKRIYFDNTYINMRVVVRFYLW